MASTTSRRSLTSSVGNDTSSIGNREGEGIGSGVGVGAGVILVLATVLAGRRSACAADSNACAGCACVKACIMDVRGAGAGGWGTWVFGTVGSLEVGTEVLEVTTEVKGAVTEVLEATEVLGAGAATRAAPIPR